MLSALPPNTESLPESRTTSFPPLLKALTVALPT
jgi:hypothetical protein